MSNAVTLFSGTGGIEPRMTSLQIAEVTGKPHADVLKAIRKMEPAWEKVTEGNFSLSEYKDPTGRKLPCYSLTREECLYIATKFNDEARAKLIKRWKELEIKDRQQMPAIPQSFAEALYLAARQQERIDEQQKALNEQTQLISDMTNSITDMQKRLSYTDMILASTTTVAVTGIAQDYGMSAKAFNIMLRDYGIQHKVAKQWVLYAKYLNEGYVQSRTYPFKHKDGKEDVSLITEWTQKGRLFLYNTLKEHDVLPLVEKR